MTEPTGPATTETASADLDFDRASFDDPNVTHRVCSGCGQPITDTYFTHGASTICPRCQPAFSEKLGRSSFGLALGYGALAGAAGALVWYGIRALTEYELGLIAIVVGVAVGIGVRKGAGPSPSKIYRVMAVVLTYLSIVSTYVPMIAADLMKDATEQSSAIVMVSYAFAAGLALVMPAFLIGGGEIMGLIIIGIGLWEAWQRSAPRPEDLLAGPFQINTGA